VWRPNKSEKNREKGEAREVGEKKKAINPEEKALMGKRLVLVEAS
jgi:hypothetical protein